MRASACGAWVGCGAPAAAAAASLHKFGVRRVAAGAPDLWLKAHVQHAVGLIQGQVGDAGEGDAPALDQVLEPPWRGHDDVAPALDVAQLRPHTQRQRLRPTGCLAQQLAGAAWEEAACQPALTACLAQLAAGAQARKTARTRVDSQLGAGASC